MHFHISKRMIYAVISFVIAFIAVMFLFIKRPDIVKSKNKLVRTVMVFALAFIPGVLTASICAKTVVSLYDSFFADNAAEIVCESEDCEEEERE